MWIKELMTQLNRNKTFITFSPHIFERKEYRNLDLDNIEETVRTGDVVIEKCQFPNKICFKRYLEKRI